MGKKMEENKKDINIIKISVRNLVEFILRSGDIDTSKGMGRDMEAMQQGSRLHRKIQKGMGEGYRAEVPLDISVPVMQDGRRFDIVVEGRADGILEEDNRTVIDEIKTMYADVTRFTEPVPVHRSQAMCYAYMYAQRKKADEIGIRLTYCNIETETIRYFDEQFSFPVLEEWFDKLMNEYAKWAGWQYSWNQMRNASIRNVQFPFPYRTGQKELVAGVYKTILRKKKLYIEAPTGVGKTVSTVFPAVKAMGEGLAEKIFYLTAKTITRTVAEDCFCILSEQKVKMKVITVTAKEKICVMDRMECSPAVCERARGHYDRVNDAVFDLLTSEDGLSRDLILAYAEKHRVCPFEMGLDAATWSDVVICDYNYVFDPNVYLKRFFYSDKQNDYVFLVDEAHNLVDRAREMYSAVLIKEEFLEAKRIIKGRSKKLESRMNACNSDLLKLKRECDEFREVGHIGDFALHLMHLMAEYEEFLKEFAAFDGREQVLDLYFAIRHFMNIYEGMNEKYIIYTDYTEDGDFRIKLQCMDPSYNLSLCLNRGRSAVFFSATLLPVRYYKDQLAGNEDDYAVYAPSPFETNRRLLMIARDVSTRYSRRSEAEYDKILEYIQIFVHGKTGNYMVFFPSYQMLNQMADRIAGRWKNIELVVQKSHMTETEKEEFLNSFVSEPERTRVGFCVMGGIFSEGIDLKEDRLIGAVIVGTGLPMVCDERELFRRYYEEVNHSGFDYAYLYNGMNKVLQSAGRVIRTASDRGAVLLLDERFQNAEYQNLFPREWYPNVTVDRRNMEQILTNFWKEAGS